MPFKYSNSFLILTVTNKHLNKFLNVVIITISFLFVDILFLAYFLINNIEYAYTFNTTGIYSFNTKGVYTLRTKCVYIYC